MYNIIKFNLYFFSSRIKDIDSIEKQMKLKLFNLDNIP